jgi:hypothetical protein
MLAAGPDTCHTTPSHSPSLFSLYPWHVFGRKQVFLCLLTQECVNLFSLSSQHQLPRNEKVAPAKASPMANKKVMLDSLSPCTENFVMRDIVTIAQR